MSKVGSWSDVKAVRSSSEADTFMSRAWDGCEWAWVNRPFEVFCDFYQFAKNAKNEFIKRGLICEDREDVFA